MMRYIDAILGGIKAWRRLRGGRWVDVYPVALPSVGGWVRTDDPLRGEIVVAAEDYRLPRAKALPPRPS